MSENLWVIINEGHIFAGTLDQFRALHGSNDNPATIFNWAASQGYTCQIRNY